MSFNTSLNIAENNGFIDIVRNNKAIFFHFLDGFLNDSGYNISYLSKFIIENNIIQNFFKPLPTKNIIYLISIGNLEITNIRKKVILNFIDIIQVIANFITFQ